MMEPESFNRSTWQLSEEDNPNNCPYCDSPDCAYQRCGADCPIALRLWKTLKEEPAMLAPNDNDQTNIMYAEPLALTLEEQLVKVVSEYNDWFESEQLKLHWHVFTDSRSVTTYYVYVGYACNSGSLVVASSNLQHVVTVLQNSLCNIEQLMADDATISQ